MNASQSQADAETQHVADSPLVTIGGRAVRTVRRSSEHADNIVLVPRQISVEAEPAAKPSLHGTLRTYLRSSDDTRIMQWSLLGVACLLVIGGVVLTLLLCGRSCTRRQSH